MDNSKEEIVLLLGPSGSSNFLYHYLKKHFVIKAAIIEEPVSRVQLIKRRAKKLGWFTVFGQLAFQVVVQRLLTATSGLQHRNLLAKYQLIAEPIEEDLIFRVPSINSDACIELLKRLSPKIIVVNGTRIISQKVLVAAACPFINTHAGITPKYRGVHGGYWALVNGDKENCGVTIHFVDKGIDTGNIIAQSRIVPEKADNFTTYPIHQLGMALPLLVEAIKNTLAGNAASIKADGESKLWHHPTVWGYLFNRILKGVK